MKKSIFYMYLVFGLGNFLLYAQNEKIVTDVEQVFTNVYDNNWWWTGETHSGCGSNLYQTQLIRQEIPRIIKKYDIQSILDIPCGDFHWMQYVDLGIPYFGADIVKELVISNQEKYGNEQRHFMHLDVISDDLPQADLILCRDCLVHLSLAQIWQALQNIKKSGAKYLLATSYSQTGVNIDISAGSWRKLNLMVAPFNFSNPILVYNEGYEGDKCLVMWKIEDLSL
jgi:hypothetical protein